MLFKSTEEIKVYKHNDAIVFCISELGYVRFVLLY